MEYEIIYQAARDADMDATLIVILLIFLSFLSCTGILSVLIVKLFKRAEVRSAARQEQIQSQILEAKVERQMLLGLGNDKITYLAKKAIRAGKISINDYTNITKYLYTPYKELGGNGTIDRLIEEIKKLDIVGCEYSSHESGKQEK